MEVESFAHKMQEEPNLKIKYKNERLEQTKQIYLCQCQKNYLSFPALYLHVKNKHMIKLTTRITDKICRIEEKEGKTYITYFLRSQEEQQRKQQVLERSEQAKKHSKNQAIRTYNEDEPERVSDKQDNQGLHGRTSLEINFGKNSQFDFRVIVQEFMTSCNYLDAQLYENSNTIMMIFANYIENCGQVSKQFYHTKKYQPERLMNSLPLYFNQFITCYLPWSLSSQRHQTINNRIQIYVMELFAKWLRQNNYTNLLLLQAIQQHLKHSFMV